MGLIGKRLSYKTNVYLSMVPFLSKLWDYRVEFNSFKAAQFCVPSVVPSAAHLCRSKPSAHAAAFLILLFFTSEHLIMAYD